MGCRVGPWAVFQEGHRAPSLPSPGCTLNFRMEEAEFQEGPALGMEHCWETSSSQDPKTLPGGLGRGRGGGLGGWGGPGPRGLILQSRGHFKRGRLQAVSQAQGKRAAHPQETLLMA